MKTDRVLETAHRGKHNKCFIELTRKHGNASDRRKAPFNLRHDRGRYGEQHQDLYKRIQDV
jgi:hypothetical protein